MALASESKKLHEYFFDILKHINWDVIKLPLEKTLFSQDELISIWRKEEKQRLKYIMRKITDSDEIKLFLQALQSTNHDVGHQKLIEILQDVDSSGKYFLLYIAMGCMYR